MNGKVLPLKVVVKEVKPEEKTTGSGIIIPETERRRPTIAGKVVLTGEGTTEVPMVVGIGDNVLFTQMSGVRFEHEGEEYILINQSDVLFIFK